jgi:hypothetical protein
LAFERAALRVRLGSVSVLGTVAAFVLPVGIAAQAQVASSAGVGSQFELTYWQSVESGSDPALYEAYLAQYPNGTFSAVARVKLARLRQPLPAAPALVPAPIAPPPPQPKILPSVARQPEPAPTPAAIPAAAPARMRLATA